MKLLSCDSMSKTAITKAIKAASSCRGVKNFISVEERLGVLALHPPPRPPSPYLTSGPREQESGMQRKKENKKGKVAKQRRGGGGGG